MSNHDRAEEEHPVIQMEQHSSSSTPLLSEEGGERMISPLEEDLDEEESSLSVHSSRGASGGQGTRFFFWSRRNYSRTLFSLLTAPVTDDQGSLSSIIVGLSVLFVAGTCIGLVMPKNNELPGRWYPVISASIGYTYFLCWSVSFYPQVLNNLRRRTTTGLR
jgi:hypothetical protein